MPALGIGVRTQNLLSWESSPPSNHYTLSLALGKFILMHLTHPITRSSGLPAIRVAPWEPTLDVLRLPWLRAAVLPCRGYGQPGRRVKLACFLVVWEETGGGGGHPAETPRKHRESTCKLHTESVQTPPPPPPPPHTHTHVLLWGSSAHHWANPYRTPPLCSYTAVRRLWLLQSIPVSHLLRCFHQSVWLFSDRIHIFTMRSSRDTRRTMHGHTHTFKQTDSLVPILILSCGRAS